MSQEIYPSTITQLNKPLKGQVHFSDTFPETAGQSEDDWWRKTDFDASLTVGVESAGFPQLAKIPIGLRHWMTSYGLVVVDDLLQARDKRVKDYLKTGNLHEDCQEEILIDQNTATAALANYAPRDDTNIANGHNGSDFYLAVTKSKLEVYATPLRFLQDLDDANRITSLFQIPTEGHPEFDGDHEQFRSARVVRTRRHVDHLIPIFQYASQQALIKAKLAGTHRQIIPQDTREGRIAFVDKFGNVRLKLKDRDPLESLAIGDTASLTVKNDGVKLGEIKIHKAKDLRSAPLGKLAMYANCSDQVNTGTNTGLAELIVRVNDDPNTSKQTAIYQLHEKFGVLDPNTIEVALEV